MIEIEFGLVKERLERILRCKISRNQVDQFEIASSKMGKSPLEAIEYLETLNLNKEEIRKIVRGE